MVSIVAMQELPVATTSRCHILCSDMFQVLEFTEQLLRQTDLLHDLDTKALPADSYAGRFLSDLGNVLAADPLLGSVITVRLPYVPTPVSVSPPKQICVGSNVGPLLW